MKRFFIFLLIFVGLFYYGSNIYFDDVNTKYDKTRKISLNIPLGTPVKKIGTMLKDKGVINHKWTFLLYLRLNNVEPKVQAGDFIFNVPISIKDLVDQLQNAKQEDIKVTIPEGSTIDDIDLILSKKGLSKEGEFIECTKKCQFKEYNFFYDGNMEGYLFPDTYFVPINNFTVEKFIKRMLGNFQIRVLTKEFTQEYKKQNKKLSDIIIMASIIEREERNIKNMGIVSGILWKRLKEGIALGADATTRYYKKSKQGNLSKDDFNEDNPYNTRKRKGLTPTAISNPGLNAIKASIYPVETIYYYYLHDDSGQVYFSETNDEHNVKKFKYIK